MGSSPGHQRPPCSRALRPPLQSVSVRNAPVLLHQDKGSHSRSAAMTTRGRIFQSWKLLNPRALGRLWGASTATWGGQLPASEAFYPLSIFRGSAILSAATSVFPEATLEEETKALGGVHREACVAESGTGSRSLYIVGEMTTQQVVEGNDCLNLSQKTAPQHTRIHPSTQGKFSRTWRGH